MIQRDPVGAVAQYDKGMTVMKFRSARTGRGLIGKCEGRKAYLDAAPEIVAGIKKLRRKLRGGRRQTYGYIAEELNRLGMTSLDNCPFTSAMVRNILFTDRMRQKTIYKAE
jgi:hypothetical protein